ncbi:cAMP-binding domain of CRP or a regulatory subunit of cAMP-dependent protein kinases [Catalinimonas alkaloidigena]|uniref:cAMP-binding domain of CRP or a regulatory subunit of cAMP-dependent protein kinases n=1 Tax=Catalinimonas alkaloidigena TaxID=1075417 RepID=A0A1G8XPB0_9BACT|nr:Crp/Fnr family transcriptional regulator [Catalinimonas alkaloidigena]SDJ91610.1 cAMP-binding domain of CRP or a regulatory subunit of cAMP-dependent protein kinases [Catalinimonas alkaloidigena]
MLATLLQQHTQLTPDAIAALLRFWQKEVTVARGDFLSRRGQVEHHLYFVQSGALWLSYPTETEDICVGFAYAPSLICSFPSFIEGRPSEYNIQALRKSELRGITRHDFYAFMQEHTALAAFWHTQIERALLGRIEREIDLMLHDPAQRLARLQARSPHLFQLVPRKYIASYLRMTPETLSRIQAQS